MQNIDFYHAIVIGSSMFFIGYGVSAYFADEESSDDIWSSFLTTMPFITQSIGVMWPLSGILLLCSVIFEGVARTQGIDVPEASAFNKAVLTCTGWLTLLFASPLLGYCTGRLCRLGLTAKG